LAFDFVNKHPFQIFKLLEKHTTMDSKFLNISESENHRFKNLKEPEVFRKERQEAVVSLGRIFAFFDLENIIFTHTHTKRFFKKKIGPDLSSFLIFKILITSL
jgi:hypothetical protein